MQNLIFEARSLNSQKYKRARPAEIFTVLATEIYV